MSEAPWFRTAVFYEVPVYAFCDSDGDGIGDFAGLTSKLDYIRWLGADCIWLLPFYESPMRDGGYDVSDFRAVRGVLGTLRDVATFLDAAHGRGLRVIADMIVNHTSDRHSWFREARRPSSPRRDFYVWSHDPQRWSEARVIFTDTHNSNWTWDEEAGAFYWHRFFSHQPDLNFNDPRVREEMKDIIRFWLDLGFDGLRLDAVPYLYERDGTNGENLPETHTYLKEIRAMVDAEYGDRMLLAEANQRPRDVVDYFGDGDECHMAYHFPLMPRLFMAVKKQQATPLVDVLAATPAIPDGCQWGIFLRNHDELTLEMVSAEERAYMWEQYAPDPQMRKNVGIRRRLAPLVDNDWDTIRLLYGLLLSLPGSPFLYYGDEIGMGDCYRLPDREGVRTPMQWTDAPGAGFSTADPADFYLPLVTDPPYTPSQINVAAQRRHPDSLLNWVHRMLAIRRRHPVLALGSYSAVRGSNPAMLAFRRILGNTEMIAIANLSAEACAVRLDIPAEARYRSVIGERILNEAGVAMEGRGFDWLVPG
ncbi:MAG: maltose alpha-D-glucosyltransferase [Acidimicrobiia bacterium]